MTPETYFVWFVLLVCCTATTLCGVWIVIAYRWMRFAPIERFHYPRFTRVIGFVGVVLLFFVLFGLSYLTYDAIQYPACYDGSTRTACVRE